MCGIHGFFTSNQNQDENNRLIRIMVASTNHRGPDSVVLKTFTLFTLATIVSV